MRAFFLLLCIAFATSILAESATSAAYQKALASYERKNFDGCIAALKSAIADADDQADLRILAAHCHTAKSNFADAVYHLKAVAADASTRKGVGTDIVNLLFQMKKYRSARNNGYKYIEAFKDDGKSVPHELSLATARACLAYGKPSEALALARDAKQSDDDDVKYLSLVTEARALIATANLGEADIALSYAEAMRSMPVHALLRANMAELAWAEKKFPENQRADIIQAYEKLTHNADAQIKAAAEQSLERVRSATAF